MDVFAKKMFAKMSPLKPAFFTWSIDDYARVWTHGQEALSDFLAFLNSQHPNLSFTMDYSTVERGVPFLDTLVSVETHDNVTKIKTKLYIKPTSSGIILHSSSAHPKNTKHSIIRNMFQRAYNNSSTKQKEETSVEKIWNMMLENGYERLLTRALLGSGS